MKTLLGFEHAYNGISVWHFSHFTTSLRPFNVSLTILVWKFKNSQKFYSDQKIRKTEFMNNWFDLYENETFDKKNVREKSVKTFTCVARMRQARNTISETVLIQKKKNFFFFFRFKWKFIFRICLHLIQLHCVRFYWNGHESMLYSAMWSEISHSHRPNQDTYFLGKKTLSAFSSEQVNHLCI